MSEQNVEIVRRVYECWGRGDFRAGTELFDPWVVLVLRPEFPDAGAYLGPEGIRGYMRGFLEGWDHAVIEGNEFMAAGDSVVVRVHQHASGKQSGVPVDWSVAKSLSPCLNGRQPGIHRIPHLPPVGRCDRGTRAVLRHPARVLHFGTVTSSSRPPLRAPGR